MEIKIRILYVHHAGGFGGAPKSMSYIIKSLDKEKYDPILVNIQDGPINEFFNTLPIKLIKVKGIRPFHGSTVVEKSLKLFVRNWLFLIPSIFRANTLIKKMNIEVIHLNSTCLFAFAIAAKWNNVKVICHIREPLRKGFWGNPLRFFCNKYVDGFIAICENDMNSMCIPKLSKVKKQVIYNFVESYKSSGQTSAFKNELGLKNQDVIFLYLARFSRGNGWIEFIEMAKKIVDFKHNYHFVLLGAQNQSQMDIVKSDNIHILPFRNDITSVLEGSDVFVCPFIEPHFARGIIEASAYGIPIIGANIGGVDELVLSNRTGFLYSNEKEFINFATQLGDDLLLRKKFGNAGILFAKENFSMDINLKKTYIFYNQVLNK